jgi:NhaP-type Na+/H+ or K+/H+ antiporter
MILFVFLVLATGGPEEGGTTALALKLVAEEIGIGVAVGIVFTLAGSWLLTRCADRGWVTETWLQLPVVALAGACFAGAQLLGGSGFIACFAGGILAGWIAKNHKHRLLLAAEGTGDTLALITWVVFGAAVLDRYVGQITWQTFVYAILSLTVIRMLPVYLALAGTGLSVGDKLFMGWFGPRGLASIVFGVIVLQEDLPGGPIIAVAVFCTILLSVITHGLTANPLAAALGGGRRAASDDGQERHHLFARDEEAGLVGFGEEHLCVRGHRDADGFAEHGRVLTHELAIRDVVAALLVAMDRRSRQGRHL